MRILFSITIVLLVHFACAQSFELKNITTNVNSSFRGMSVVDNLVAWVSGSHGWIGISTDGGKTWTFTQVKGFENADFRSLYAFDDQRAIIANAGAPANILVTSDGGKSWEVVYTNTHEAAFFDGIDFWNDQDGLIYGDPIQGQMLLLKTNDGGNHWESLPNAPFLKSGEASFAASGTGIRCIGKNKAMIVTGGVASRLWTTEDRGNTWTSITPPILQGEPTTGIYSFSILDSSIVLVGGDYTRPNLTTQHHLYSTDNGASWKTPNQPSRGYRECVEFLDRITVIATGPTGTDISTDGGKTWSSLSDETGYHVLRKARNGAVALIAGSKGSISIILEK